VALTNSQKQARWRQRNQVRLTDTSAQIAEQLLNLPEFKLREVMTRVDDYLKNPNTLKRRREEVVAFFEKEEMQRRYMAREITKEVYDKWVNWRRAHPR
jgi:hypothetical protein